MTATHPFGHANGWQRSAGANRQHTRTTTTPVTGSHARRRMATYCAHVHKYRCDLHQVFYVRQVILRPCPVYTRPMTMTVLTKCSGSVSYEVEWACRRDRIEDVVEDEIVSLCLFCWLYGANLAVHQALGLSLGSTHSSVSPLFLFHPFRDMLHAQPLVLEPLPMVLLP